MAFQPLHCSHTPRHREWRNCDEVQLVGNMPCLNFQLSIYRSRNLINSEWLALHGIRWLGKDDISFFQILSMDTIRRADKFQLVAAVSLFRHNTGLCVGQFSDAVMVEIHLFGII